MASIPSDLDRLILRLTQDVYRASGRPLHRTQLVKLVYLVDYFYSQQTGQTLTGAKYKWDRHGPNVQGNQVVIRADILCKEGKLNIERTKTPGGTPRYLYEPMASIYVPPFEDKLAEAVVATIVQRYARLDWNAITSVAKGTLPFKTAKQGDLLDLSPDRDRLADLQLIEAELARQPIRRGALVSLTDLKAQHGATG